MKTIRLVLTLLIASTAVHSFGQESPRAVLQGNYDKISRLSIKRDKVRLEHTIRRNAASNFQYIDSLKNSLDLSATVRQNTEQISRIYKFNSNSNKIVGMKAKGRDFVCTVKTDYDVLMSPAGKIRLTGVTVSEDTWTKTLTGWKIKTSKTINEKSTLHNEKVTR